jgi:nitroimidazol reductase NimA-like FMN-containing flavoprotein (pyridoxamine 5'-phosphate oxidase superfamily)
MDPMPVSARTRITRLPDRQVTERQALYDLLDAALVAHVGVVRDGAPVVLPLGFARDGDSILLHGSTGGGLLRAAAAGAPVAVTVTLLDGLVFARSLFDSSMNYRSAMITGAAHPVPLDQQDAALQVLADHLMPGRWAEVRATRRRELAATLVLRLPLAEASVKVRAHGASSSPDDGEDRDAWAGVLPLRVVAGEPQRSEDTPASVPLPASVLGILARLAARPVGTP